MKTRSLSERFWKKVDQNGPTHPVLGTPCWVWTASRFVRGYGALKVDDGPKGYAHRISWELHFGPIPDGLWVLHRCDNPPCVNPAHLFLGTHLDNMADMDAKGRRNHPGRAKTHCKRGHEFTPENTRTREKGHRTCITCEKAKGEAHYQRHRAAILERCAARHRRLMATDPEPLRRRAREWARRQRARLRDAASHSSPPG